MLFINSTLQSTIQDYNPSRQHLVEPSPAKEPNQSSSDLWSHSQFSKNSWRLNSSTTLFHNDNALDTLPDNLKTSLWVLVSIFTTFWCFMYKKVNWIIKKNDMMYENIMHWVLIAAALHLSLHTTYEACLCTHLSLDVYSVNHDAMYHISSSLSVYKHRCTSSGPSVCPWSSDSIRSTDADLIWFSGSSCMGLILDKSAQSSVLITTILGKKLKLIQEYGSRCCCCRVNSRWARLRLDSFPVCEQEPFGGNSRWRSVLCLFSLI